MTTLNTKGMKYRTSNRTHNLRNHRHLFIFPHSTTKYERNSIYKKSKRLNTKTSDYTNN